MVAVVVLQHLRQIHLVLRHLRQILLVLQLIHGVLPRLNHHLNLQRLLILGDQLLHHKRLIHSVKHRHFHHRIHQMDLVQVQQIHSVLHHQLQIHNLHQLLLIHLDNRQVNISITDIFTHYKDGIDFNMSHRATPFVRDNLLNHLSKHHYHSSKWTYK